MISERERRCQFLDEKFNEVKNKLCKRKNVILVRIKYDEPLTKTHIKNKIKRMGIEI